jgi:hypothetical protein
VSLSFFFLFTPFLHLVRKEREHLIKTAMRAGAARALLRSERAFGRGPRQLIRFPNAKYQAAALAELQLCSAGQAAPGAKISLTGNAGVNAGSVGVKELLEPT